MLFVLGQEASHTGPVLEGKEHRLLEVALPLAHELRALDAEVDCVADVGRGVGPDEVGCALVREEHVARSAQTPTHALGKHRPRVEPPDDRLALGRQTLIPTASKVLGQRPVTA